MPQGFAQRCVWSIAARNSTISDAGLAGRGIRLDRKAVTTIRLKTRLVVPRIRVLEIINTFRGRARVINMPAAKSLPDAFPAPREPPADVFLEYHKSDQDDRDERHVFHQRLSASASVSFHHR